MLDYYSSFIKPKHEIYTEIKSYYSNYSDDYIHSKLDELYSMNIITKDVSINGWIEFIRHFVKENVDNLIKKDLEKAKLNLLTMKILKSELITDIIYKICFN
jgi:hypothetical protein